MEREAMCMTALGKWVGVADLWYAKQRISNAALQLRAQRSKVEDETVRCSLFRLLNFLLRGSKLPGFLLVTPSTIKLWPGALRSGGCYGWQAIPFPP